MAGIPFTNATIWFGGADLSGHGNDVTLEGSAADLNVTNFASGGSTEHRAGLRSAKVDVKGLWEAGSAGLPDDLSFAELGVGSVPLTVAPLGATVGGVAFFGTFTTPSYKTAGKVGEILSFETAPMSDAPLIRGQVANASTVSATGTTTGLNLGAVGVGQRLWCALHVLTVTGGTPSLTVTVQSASGSGFASPTTVVTGAAITAPGFQYLEGPVGVSTDTWQRLSLVVSGTSPSFLLYAALGIG